MGSFWQYWRYYSLWKTSFSSVNYFRIFSKRSI